MERNQRMLEARGRLRALKQRARLLRRRVFATSLVCFALLWAVVFAQLVSGHDPVLAQSATKVATAAQEEVGSEADVEAEAEAQAEAGAEALELEAVTTGQS